MIGAYSEFDIILFFGVIFLFLFIDLKSTPHDEPVSLKTAALWSGIWMAVSLLFAAYIGVKFGPDKAFLFLSGYLVEQSLSVDNLFVFMAVFSGFAIADRLQHRILYYGIVGAIIFRFLFIVAGASLLRLGDAVLGIFAVIILWSAWQMWRQGGADREIEDYSHHWSVRLVNRFLPTHPRLEGGAFFIRKSADGGGKTQLLATPLFLCLVCVEISDIAFAFDSVPAIIVITKEVFLIYTSNIFAILGLRSMYFCLHAAKRSLRHLEKAVIAILIFIGAKMLLELSGVYTFTIPQSLAVIVLLLAAGVIASRLFPEEQ